MADTSEKLVQKIHDDASFFRLLRQAIDRLIQVYIKNRDYYSASHVVKMRPRATTLSKEEAMPFIDEFMEIGRHDKACEIVLEHNLGEEMLEYIAHNAVKKGSAKGLQETLVALQRNPTVGEIEALIKKASSTF